MAFRDGDDTGVSLTMKLKCGVKRPYIMNMDVIMEFSELCATMKPEKQAQRCFWLDKGNICSLLAQSKYSSGKDVKCVLAREAPNITF